MVKTSALRGEDPGFEFRLCWDFSRVESYQWLQNWHSSGYPARHLALKGQCWDWLSCVSILWLGEMESWICNLWKVGSATSISVWQHAKLSRSVPEIHSHVAGMLSNQQTNESPIACCWDVKQPTNKLMNHQSHVAGTLSNQPTN